MSEIRPDFDAPEATRRRVHATYAKVALIVVLLSALGIIGGKISERRRNAAAATAAAAATESRLSAMRGVQLEADCLRAGRKPSAETGVERRQCADAEGALHPAPEQTDAEKAAILPLYRQVFADRLAARGLPPMLPPASTAPHAPKS